jgi:hypothetical protein
MYVFKVEGGKDLYIKYNDEDRITIITNVGSYYLGQKTVILAYIDGNGNLYKSYRDGKVKK